jgi:hypothetical protein
MGPVAMSFKNSHSPEERHIDSVLGRYLSDYGAGLIIIDHKYPLGDKERPEWIEAHEKNGVKRIKEIMAGAANAH